MALQARVLAAKPDSLEFNLKEGEPAPKGCSLMSVYKGGICTHLYTYVYTHSK